MNMERKRSAALGGGSSTAWPAATSQGEVVTMTSTEAQNGFGRMLDAVARGGTVLITKHNATQAVVISVDRYQALTSVPDPDLDALTAEFDALLKEMQAPGAEEAMLEAFRASPEELGQAAIAAAKRNPE
jgi:prevent-host-death family protein